MNAEIYPLDVRATCISIATCVNWVSNFGVAMSFLDLSKAVSTDRDAPKDHPDGAFWLYALIGLIGWVWLYFTMPETKGLTMEAIEELFTKESDKQNEFEIKQNEKSPILPRQHCQQQREPQSAT